MKKGVFHVVVDERGDFFSVIAESYPRSDHKPIYGFSYDITKACKMIAPSRNITPSKFISMFTDREFDSCGMRVARMAVESENNYWEII